MTADLSILACVVTVLVVHRLWVRWELVGKRRSMIPGSPEGVRRDG